MKSLGLFSSKLSSCSLMAASINFVKSEKIFVGHGNQVIFFCKLIFKFFNYLEMTLKASETLIYKEEQI